MIQDNMCYHNSPNRFFICYNFWHIIKIQLKAVRPKTSFVTVIILMIMYIFFHRHELFLVDFYTSFFIQFTNCTINRIFAWVIGLRATQLALLKALLEPAQEFKKLEDSYNFTERLYLGEEMKTLPFGIVYDYFCYKHGKKSGLELEQQLKTYENEVLRKRG